MQCDGYGAYKSLAGAGSDDGVTLAFCWSHLRREFYDLAKAGAPIATETLSRIASLYQIETKIRGITAERRLAVRQAESRPLVDDLHAWFTAQLPKLPGRGPTAEAIRYALNHWDGLEQFLEDGRIELDTNSIERAMKPIILSRKNSLFAGSDEGGANWSCMASLIETCKLNQVNPQVYFTDLAHPTWSMAGRNRASTNSCLGTGLLCRYSDLPQLIGCWTIAYGLPSSLSAHLTGVRHLHAIIYVYAKVIHIAENGNHHRENDSKLQRRHSRRIRSASGQSSH